ncbi:MAG: WbqC family protein [Candidatus Marinimicrobia bacterium]|nr:WbqC family protein [Candidatus Neomarinimicrobiota bacterium]
MICSIHQPQTFPWLGYFAKIRQSDIFVFLDNVQFKKNEWQNRNKILSDDSWQWLTVPVIHHFGQSIREVTINPTERWRQKHLQALQTNYAKSPFFENYFPEIQSLYEIDWTLLSDFNIRTVRWGMEKLGIETPTRVASEIEELAKYPDITPDDRLILITQLSSCETYLSGEGGHNYLEPAHFSEKNIRLIFQKFNHPAYRQFGDRFVSHLSFLDVLFFMGPGSLKIIEGGIQDAESE